MAGFRRRSWRSGRSQRNDGMRLSTMIVLLVVVLVMMLVANRPHIWSHLVPNLNQPAPAHSAGEPAQAASAPPQAVQAPRRVDRQSPLLLGSLIVVAIAYFAWRITRLSRAISRRSEAKRTKHQE